MNIYRSVYQHEPVPGKRCRGSLLKVEFGAWRTGYADLHPWPEYGDLELEEQFNQFMGGNPSMLFFKALFFAAEDATARRSSRNLLSGLDLPASHYLLLDGASAKEAMELGYNHLKVKFSDIEKITALPKEARLRVDLHAKFTFADFHLWWEDLPDDVRSRIDAIEDPWHGLGGEFEHPSLLFQDWGHDSRWKSRILKPARDICDGGETWARVIFTHSLDHPLGQAAALWEAARFYKKRPGLKEVGGFPQDLHSFKDYYHNWQSNGPRRKPTPGHGFGFDEQLHSLRWERVL